MAESRQSLVHSQPSGAHEDVRPHQWSSRREMEDALVAPGVQPVLLGEDASHAATYLTLPVGRLMIAVISESVTAFPCIFLSPEFRHLLVGYNKNVALITKAAGNIVKVVQLYSRFDEFVPVHSGLVVVMFETGALGLTSEGAELWREDNDVVQDFQLNGGVLTLDFIDAPTVRVDVLTGRRL
jgi:hypothetical protein